MHCCVSLLDFVLCRFALSEVDYEYSLVSDQKTDV